MVLLTAQNKINSNKLHGPNPLFHTVCIIFSRVLHQRKHACIFLKSRHDFQKAAFFSFFAYNSGTTTAFKVRLPAFERATNLLHLKKKLSFLAIKFTEILATLQNPYVLCVKMGSVCFVCKIGFLLLSLHNKGFWVIFLHFPTIWGTLHVSIEVPKQFFKNCIFFFFSLITQEPRKLKKSRFHQSKEQKICYILKKS